MASLLAIYRDSEPYEKVIKVVFLISVDVIKHNEACKKFLISYLEAL